MLRAQSSIFKSVFFLTLDTRLFSTYIHLSPTCNLYFFFGRYMQPIYQYQYIKLEPSNSKFLILMNAKVTMSSISGISSTLLKRTIPFCSISKTTSSTTTTLLSSLKSPWPMFPTRPQFARLSDVSSNQYPARSPPEFSPPLPGFDQPCTPPEVPGVSTSPEVDIPTTTPPEVSPYPPPLDPAPDFPVPPVPDVPLPFPDNPIPGPDRLPPQPPDIVPPPPPGPEIIPPPAPPPPATGPGGAIVV